MRWRAGTGCGGLLALPRTKGSCSSGRCAAAHHRLRLSRTAPLATPPRMGRRLHGGGERAQGGGVGGGGRRMCGCRRLAATVTALSHSRPRTASDARSCGAPSPAAGNAGCTVLGRQHPRWHAHAPLHRQLPGASPASSCRPASPLRSDDTSLPVASLLVPACTMPAAGGQVCCHLCSTQHASRREGEGLAGSLPAHAPQQSQPARPSTSGVLHLRGTAGGCAGDLLVGRPAPLPGHGGGWRLTRTRLQWQRMAPNLWPGGRQGRWPALHHLLVCKVMLGQPC